MRLEVKGRNVEVNDSIRRYAEDKLDKIERQLPEATQIEVELAFETNPSIAEDHIAEATVWTKGSTLRVRERSARVRDLDRPARRQARAAGEAVPREAKPARDGSACERARSDEPTFSGAQLERMIVKSKQFDLQPLTPDEATVELELIGHDFFVFTNVETGRQNVVYRRRDGAYGSDRATAVDGALPARQPLHEQFAEQADLDIGADDADPEASRRTPSRLAGLMHGLADGFLTAPPDEFGRPSPFGEVALHGVPRARRVGHVVTAEPSCR